MTAPTLSTDGPRQGLGGNWPPTAPKWLDRLSHLGVADCLAKPDPCRERTTRRKDDGPMSNTSMGSGGVDPAAIAQSELAANTVPTPEDVLADVSPLTQLWYARETCYAAMRVMAATLSVGDDEAPPDDSEPVRALSALSEACGTLDGACTLVGLLPEGYASANG